MYTVTGTLINPILRYFGKVVSRKVTINVLVFRVPPESALTVILSLATTPCDFRPLRISSLSLSISSRYLITPLQVFSDQ